MQEFIVEDLAFCKPVLNRLGKTEFGSWTRNASEALASAIVNKAPANNNIQNVSLEVSISTLPFDDFTVKSWMNVKLGDSVIIARVEADANGFKIGFVRHAWFKQILASKDMLTLTVEFEAYRDENLKHLASLNFVAKISESRASELQILRSLHQAVGLRSNQLPDSINDYLLGIEDDVDFLIESAGENLVAFPSHFSEAQQKCFRSVMSSKLSISYGPFISGTTTVLVHSAAKLASMNERTVIITKTAAGLSEIHSQLVALGVKENYVARPELGADFSQLSKHYSKLLKHAIEAISKFVCSPLGLSDVESCNDCEYIWKVFILPRWKAFSLLLSSAADIEQLKSAYPFAKCELFKLDSFENHFACISELFDTVRELSALEKLKDPEAVATFAMSNLSKVVLMTTSFAASKRHVLSKMNLEFDNIFVDEAQSIPEAESLLLLSLQKNSGKLKRLALFGHQMLNSSLTLFQRFLAYGFASATVFPELPSDLVSNSPYALFKKNLASLPEQLKFIDVTPILAYGEEEPIRNYYLNLDEAEYAVALYQLFRLNHVDSESIAIITTSQGQVDLINEVFVKRCDWNPMFGKPKFIGTIEQSLGMNCKGKSCTC